MPQRALEWSLPRARAVLGDHAEVSTRPRSTHLGSLHLVCPGGDHEARPRHSSVGEGLQPVWPGELTRHDDQPLFKGAQVPELASCTGSTTDHRPGPASVDPGAHRSFVERVPAGRLAREHLLTVVGRIVATFDVDALLDYRSRRPVMLFVEDLGELRRAVADPAPAARQLQHPVPAVVELTRGLQVGSSAAMIHLIDQLEVRLTVGFNAVDGGAAHGRPGRGARRRDLISGYEPWLRRVQVPRRGPGTCWKYRLGQQGGTRSVSPSTCRTTWPRASTRRPPNA